MSDEKEIAPTNEFKHDYDRPDLICGSDRQSTRLDSSNSESNKNPSVFTKLGSGLKLNIRMVFDDTENKKEQRDEVIESREGEIQFIKTIADGNSSYKIIIPTKSGEEQISISHIETIERLNTCRFDNKINKDPNVNGLVESALEKNKLSEKYNGQKFQFNISEFLSPGLEWVAEGLNSKYNDLSYPDRFKVDKFLISDLYPAEDKKNEDVLNSTQRNLDTARKLKDGYYSKLTKPHLTTLQMQHHARNNPGKYCTYSFFDDLYDRETGQFHQNRSDSTIPQDIVFKAFYYQTEDFKILDIFMLDHPPSDSEELQGHLYKSNILIYKVADSSVPDTPPRYKVLFPMNSRIPKHIENMDFDGSYADSQKYISVSIDNSAYPSFLKELGEMSFNNEKCHIPVVKRNIFEIGSKKERELKQKNDNKQLVYWANFDHTKDPLKAHTSVQGKGEIFNQEDFESQAKTLHESFVQRAEDPHDVGESEPLADSDPSPKNMGSPMFSLDWDGCIFGGRPTDKVNQAVINYLDGAKIHTDDGQVYELKVERGNLTSISGAPKAVLEKWLQDNRDRIIKNAVIPAFLEVHRPLIDVMVLDDTPVKHAISSLGEALKKDADENQGNAKDIQAIYRQLKGHLEKHLQQVDEQRKKTPLEYADCVDIHIHWMKTRNIILDTLSQEKVNQHQLETLQNLNLLLENLVQPRWKNALKNGLEAAQKGLEIFLAPIGYLLQYNAKIKAQDVILEHTQTGSRYGTLGILLPVIFYALPMFTGAPSILAIIGTFIFPGAGTAVGYLIGAAIVALGGAWLGSTIGAGVGYARGSYNLSEINEIQIPQDQGDDPFHQLQQESVEEDMQAVIPTHPTSESKNENDGVDVHDIRPLTFADDPVSIPVEVSGDLPEAKISDPLPTDRDESDDAAARKGSVSSTPGTLFKVSTAPNSPFPDPHQVKPEQHDEQPESPRSQG